VASRINLLVDIPSFAAAEVLFPKASQAAAEGTTKVKYLYEKMVAVLLAFTLPTALVIILLPHLITVVIAGPKYALSAPILQMYMVTGIFRPAQNQAANLLNSIGKPKLVFWANTGTLFGFLVINYACLLEFGFYGAAIGTMVTAMVGFVFWYFIMRRHIDMELKNVGQYTLDVYKTAYRMVKGALKKAKANARL
jgi:O-antigen/teichoic acid export membrane protein